MSFSHLPKSLVLFFSLWILFQGSYAHNGAIAYAYPMESIKVDADLSDWPSALKKYPISFYQYGFKPESENDIRGYFVIGYNQQLQEVYIAVEMEDDFYIRNEENPQYWAHDMQVLYIDPQHQTESTGVFALEVNEYFRKIVDHEVNWDPFVLNASWDMVEVKALNNGKKTIYEWKIKLDGFIKEGRTIGFDYVVFDKDSADGNSNTVGWGPDEGIKHECSKCLGDVVLMPSKGELSEISGIVSTDMEGVLPRSLRLRSLEDKDQFVNTRINSTGAYGAKIPLGSYRAEIPGGIVEVDDKYYRITGGEGVLVNSLPSGATKVEETAKVKVISPPDLIPAKGILHDFNAESENALNEFVEAYRSYYGIPGVSLALIKDGKLLYHNTYGYKNSFTKQPVVETTLFEAASITKPVFAYVVLRLAERDVIDLDKPLAEYLPFEDLEEYPEYKKMTGRHVLIHRTGLPNWGREMQAEPGEKYGYSGEGFEYLKRVVAHITGREVDEIVDEELKNLQGIEHMFFKENPQLASVAATGHINESPTVRFLPQEAGMAWSMYTEAKDFTKFALTLLHREGLKQDTFDEMMTIHSMYPEDERSSESYDEGMGLGVYLRYTDHGKVFGHSGNNGDFKCNFEVYEDLGMGYVMYTNSNTGDQLTDVLAQFLIEGKKESKSKEGDTQK